LGWHDRDYADGVQGDSVAARWGITRPPPATLALMVLHGAAYLLMVALGQSQGLAGRLVLSGGAANRLGILLHQLGTTSFPTALFVVLALWSVGGRLETRLGKRHLLALYVVCNLAAGAAYLAVARGVPALAALPLDYPVGGLAGFCVVAALRLRNEAVLVFGRVTSAPKLYVVCGAIVIVLAIADARLGAVGWLSSLIAGGLAALLVEYWTLVEPRQYPVRRKVRRALPRAVPPPIVLEEPDIDDLLAKISREGLASLTDAERRRLEAARQAKLRK
jgi:membrane associated rhomboid family serine protease